MTDPFHNYAPLIETERTIMRQAILSDFDAFAAFWADPEVTLHIGGRPFSRGESWTRFLRNAGLWPILGYGNWLIFDRNTGMFWGTAGIADYGRGIAEIAGIPEAGWAITPVAKGRGIATEIVAAVTHWADTNLPGLETCCIINPGNIASVRVAEKCGYVFDRLADYDGNQTQIFKRRKASPL